MNNESVSEATSPASVPDPAPPPAPEGASQPPPAAASAPASRPSAPACPAASGPPDAGTALDPVFGECAHAEDTARTAVKMAQASNEPGPHAVAMAALAVVQAMNAQTSALMCLSGQRKYAACDAAE